MNADIPADGDMSNFENIAGKFVEVPARIKRLPRNGSGYPVPYFVSWIEGAPDFRVVDPQKINDALLFQLCWICGQKLGANKAFVVGPMCAINRTSGEPPSHLECALFAVKVCPFMVNPEMRRREAGMPEGAEHPGGIMLKRNPGVSLVWVTRSFKPFRVRRNTEQGIQEGVLLKMGDPDEMLWFARGREATAEEIAASIESGIPALMEMADKEGPEAVAALRDLQSGLMEMIPGMKSMKPRVVKVSE